MSKNYAHPLSFCVLVLFTAVFMCGCSLRVSQPVTSVHGLGSSLISIGQWCIWLGVGAVILSSLARVAGFFPATAAIVAIASPFLGEVAALGAATAVIGGVVVWCGVHSWLLYTVALAVGGIYLFRHRALALRYLGVDQKKTVTDDVIAPRPAGV